MNSISWILATLSQPLARVLENTANALTGQGAQVDENGSNPASMIATATITLFGLIYIAPRIEAYLMGRASPIVLSQETPVGESFSSTSSSSSSANRTPAERSNSSVSASSRTAPVTTAQVALATTTVAQTTFVGTNSSASSSSSSTSSSSSQPLVEPSQQSAVALQELKQGLDAWCNAKLGTAEYVMRLHAAESIKNCYLTQGDELDLSVFRLILLSTDFGQLQLNINPLTSIPEQICQLQNLKKLILNDNQLVFIPEQIGQLQNLESLYLSYNGQLSSLPMGIFDLPRRCTVDLTGCPFSSSVLERIRERTSSPNYNGPRISHSVNDRVTQTSDRPLEELLPELYQIISRSAPTFNALLPLPSSSKPRTILSTWLGRLAYIADFQKGGDKKTKLALKVAEYLELAETDPAFRVRFFEIIEEAGTTCGDRMALSVIYLGIAKRLATTSLDNLAELSHLLIHGVWAMDQLEKIAREKILTLPFFDEIEVYLGYFIGLREKLALPLDVEEMLFWGCSSLSTTDLDHAYTTVSANIQSDQKQCEFLVTQPIWRKALDKKAPDAYAKAFESADPTQALIELTKSIIKQMKGN